jgi:exopolyphosphatase/guanosine-5'-triphosphate,3'-diphosphate pyrophosphatase
LRHRAPELAIHRSAVIDIGSNSVRLVVYEGFTRNLTPIFNEKVMAGLGREVQSTGLITADAIAVAHAALRRFRALCDTLRVRRVFAIATAACRDASNGKAFIAKAKQICGVPVRILTGPEEARYTALGVVSAFYETDGIVADLGGGSLELADIDGARIRLGKTMPLGGLALQDISGHSIKKAQKFVATRLAGSPMLHGGRGRVLYAVGGTWRALARLHMHQTRYPLLVMHGYEIPAKEAIAYCRRLYRGVLSRTRQLGAINKGRRALLPYAALVLEGLLRESGASKVVISVHGVREGLLYSRLPPAKRREDALIAAAGELNVLRSRSPKHGEELVHWTDRLMHWAGVDETADERRLRHAAGLLADIGWRAHPDYRGEQSLNIIANGGFAAIDHPGRVYLALAVYFRHAGPDDTELSPRLQHLTTPRLMQRARILAAAMRVAFQLSASQTGVLPKTPLVVSRGRLILKLHGPRMSALGGERVFSRLKTLARLTSLKPQIMSDNQPAHDI